MPKGSFVTTIRQGLKFHSDPDKMSDSYRSGGRSIPDEPRTGGKGNGRQWRATNEAASDGGTKLPPPIDSSGGSRSLSGSLLLICSRHNQTVRPVFHRYRQVCISWPPDRYITVGTGAYGQNEIQTLLLGAYLYA